MNSLQPKERSFGYYIRLAYEYFSNKKMDKKQLILLSKASNVDDSVLLMDDILDNSSKRNGKLTYHRRYGIPRTIIDAQINYAESSLIFFELMKLCKIKLKFRELIVKMILLNTRDVYLGERIDMDLENNTCSHGVLKKKYFKMVKLFTGGHIYYGLAIGQLLANKLPNKTLGISAIHAGTIRQIVDDFKDYFEEHHEPFGDFLTSSNRLPEILFRKHHGNREKAISLIEKGRYADAREILLTSDIRKELYLYCEQEHSSMDEKHPLTTKILMDYEIILTRK